MLVWNLMMTPKIKNYEKVSFPTEYIGVGGCWRPTNALLLDLDACSTRGKYINTTIIKYTFSFLVICNTIYPP